MKAITFNVNKNIKVKLKEAGIKILVNEFVSQELPEYLRPTEEAIRARVDKDGWFTLSLWQFMMIFGPSTNLGLDLPYETDIQFLTSDFAVGDRVYIEAKQLDNSGFITVQGLGNEPPKITTVRCYGIIQQTNEHSSQISFEDPKMVLSRVQLNNQIFLANGTATKEN